MATEATFFLSEEAYLAHERQAIGRSEHLKGDVLLMAGASCRHNLITMNLSALFYNQLREKEYSVYASDQRVKVSKTLLYAYPDVVVISGGKQFVDEQQDTLLNPVLLLEVLSPSTQDYDRGAKSAHYRTTTSLREYWTVHQDEPWIEQWSREESGWRLQGQQESWNRVFPR